MPKTDNGFHQKGGDMGAEWDWRRNLRGDQCGCCLKAIPLDRPRLVEFRPTGKKFVLQKHLYCTDCMEFVDASQILYCDPEQISRVRVSATLFYQTTSQTNPADIRCL